jgi:hypothetical protein
MSSACLCSVLPRRLLRLAYVLTYMRTARLYFLCTQNNAQQPATAAGATAGGSTVPDTTTAGATAGATTAGAAAADASQDGLRHRIRGRVSSDTHGWYNTAATSGSSLGANSMPVPLGQAVTSTVSCCMHTLCTFICHIVYFSYTCFTNICYCSRSILQKYELPSLKPA